MKASLFEEQSRQPTSLFPFVFSAFFRGQNTSVARRLPFSTLKPLAVLVTPKAALRDQPNFSFP